MKEECAGAEEKSGGVCAECKTDPVFFCADDVLTLCWECGDSDTHRTHTLIPHERALQDTREELRASMQPLFQSLRSLTKVQQTCRKMAEHITMQSTQTERQIKADFDKLRRFLRREEEERVAAVKEEQARKTRALRERAEEMRRETCRLLHALKASQMELEMEGPDGLHFLENYKNTVKRVWKANQSPGKAYDSLIDVPKHVSNLRFRVWEKMQEMCPYIPVTLDPNTACPFLLISDDLTSVRDSGVDIDCDAADDGGGSLPDNPERFSSCGEMLAREVVSTSVPQHQPLCLSAHPRSGDLTSWVVDVGDNSNWIVGVARRSISRKSLVAACPDNGYWALSLRRSRYEALEAPAVPLHVARGDRGQTGEGPHRVKVRVSQASGRVCFSDADRHTHLYTFSQVSGESLQPYLATCCHRCPLKVLPTSVAVTTSRPGPGGQDEEDGVDEEED